MKSKILFYSISLLCLLTWSACVTSDAYQNQVNIKNASWSSEFTPSFTFEVEDTAALYNISAMIRHDDSYIYNNIWLKLYIQKPNDSTFSDSFQVDFTLSDEKGYWLGLQQSNFYIHKLNIIHPDLQKFTTPGTYTIKVKHLMRTDPLPAIMNVGIRLDKRKN